MTDPAQPGSPVWDEWCEAHRLLADVELAQGGSNGPTIRLRGQLQKLRASRGEALDAARYRTIRDVHSGFEVTLKGAMYWNEGLDFMADAAIQSQGSPSK